MNLKAQNRIFIPHSFTKLLALIFIFCMMSCVTAQATTASTNYIDESGNPQTTDATVLTGNETTLAEGWYVVNSSITFDHTIILVTNADVRIILADGATMTINAQDKGISTNASELGHLYIYGQSGNTGTLKITAINERGIDMFSFTQNGGNIDITSHGFGITAASKVNINGGNLSIKVTGSNSFAIFAGGYANEWLYRGYITIKGGTVSADKGFYAGPVGYISSSYGPTGTITLGSGNKEEYIKASSYSARTVRIADGQTLSDGTNTYSGTLTSDQINAIAGKKLQWVELYSYIDENGEEKQVTATPLKSSSQTQSLKDGWYIVNEDVNITDVPEDPYSGKTGFYLSGNSIHIILADGKTMTIGSNNEQFSSGLNNYGISNLYIYGQKEQTGTLKIYAHFPIDARNAFIQNGGNIILSADNGTRYSCGIFASRTVNINNGTLSIDIKGGASSHAINTGRSDYKDIEGSITISGGKVRAKGANLYAGYTPTYGGAQGTITLGYRNKTDYISADAYNAKTVKVADGQAFIVSGDTSQTLYSGTLTPDQINAIQGETLVPYEVYTISYDYALSSGEVLLNEGYIMIVSLDESVDVMSMQIDDAEENLIRSDDKRMYLALLSSSDVLASTFALRARDSSNNTTYLFVSDNPADDLTEGTHDIALNYSTVKGKYLIAGLDAGLLNPLAYSPTALPMLVLNPARKGYTFNGWTSSPEITLTASGDGYAIPKNTNVNLKLTANWNLNTYEITYVDAGSMSSTQYTVNTDTFTLDHPTKEGYTFLGWTGTGLDGATQSVTIPAGSTGNRTYTARWQKSFKPADTTKIEIPQHSMILGSQIVVMFYVYLPEGSTPGNYTMVFDVSGDKTENPNPTVYYESVSDGGYTLYGYRCYVNSVQMADTIHAQLYSGDNVVLSEDYTAKTYLDRIIASDDVFTSKTVNLCKAIKNYGSYVQIPLAAENGWTIGREHAKMKSADKYDDDAVLLAKQGVADYAVSKDSNAPSFTYALYLDSKTTLVVSFDSTITDLKCVSGDVSNNILTIADISAHELGNVYTITGQNGDNTFTVKISPLSYVYGVLFKDTTEVVTGIKNGVISLYDYYYRTMRYRTKHSAE